MWSKKGKKRSAENHYPTMKIEEIIGLKECIENISDENCILFLWVTFPCLLEGLEVMKQWGFKYKTCGFNWVKRNKKSNTYFFGLGYWTRANSEICLIGTKGTIKRKSSSVFQIIDTPIEEHSKKPAVVREKKLLNLLEIYQELNCLQERKLKAGMYGVMKSKVILN